MSIWCERQDMHIFSYSWQTELWVMCEWRMVCTHRLRFSVFFPLPGCLESLSHASAFGGISLKWFRITWALRLWSLAAVCAVLKWYSMIYNNIIDHYVSWHSTLNQNWFISQMMKGVCRGEIKGGQRKSQTLCQHKWWDSLNVTCLYSNFHNIMSTLRFLYLSY